MNNLYARLAKINIKNNLTLYIPYLVSGIIMVTMFYCINFLYTNEGLKHAAGGDNMATLLGIGVKVIAFIAAIFLFYTNSFIIKRRKKEFGVYNILPESVKFNASYPIKSLYFLMFKVF